jgi:hypothetical protein
MEKGVVILTIMFLAFVPSSFAISWDCPDNVEGGSYYESIIMIEDLNQSQVIIIGEFYPVGTIIEGYAIEGAYDDAVSYVGDENDYVIFQLRALERDVRITIRLIAPNKDSSESVVSELLYILSPTEFGAKDRTIALTEPIRLEMPMAQTISAEEIGKGTGNWIKAMALLLVATALFVVYEDRIHDNAIRYAAMGKTKGKKYYTSAMNSVSSLMLQIQESKKQTGESMKRNLRSASKEGKVKKSRNQTKKRPAEIKGYMKKRAK